jgi:predicted alpha/beta hydrolase family esterase
MIGRVTDLLTREAVEAAWSRVSMFGQVLPRAVAGSRHHSLRGWGESATDELFIAISALYREAPQLDAVRAAVEQCQVAAPSLSALGVAGTLAEPPPPVELGLTRRWMPGLTYEHLELRSSPVLPEALAAYAGTQVAHVRLLRHREARPWVLWVHGAEQGRVDDVFAFRAKYLHQELGLNVALPVLPQHGPRRIAGQSWPGFDLLGNVATMLRAVSDVRTTLAWIGGPATVVGMSLGGPVAALASGVDPAVNGVAAMVPMLDANATIAHHVARNGERGRELAALLRDEAVVACSSAVNPLALEPLVRKDRRLVVAALNDRMTSVTAAERLHARWDGRVHWHPGGHIGHLLSGDVRNAVDVFVLSR